MVIFKYNLDWVINTVLILPDSFEILNVGVEDDKPIIWIKVDPNQVILKNKQTIIVVPTGYFEVPDNLVYINTLQKSNGYTAHFFKGELNE